MRPETVASMVVMSPDCQRTAFAADFSSSSEGRCAAAIPQRITSDVAVAAASHDFKNCFRIRLLFYRAEILRHRFDRIGVERSLKHEVESGLAFRISGDIVVQPLPGKALHFLVRGPQHLVGNIANLRL